ncbi:MAG: DEAD/DEAH box helicase [Spirochaetales bacterium]|jgi:ATP-dependent RNA helicase RhlB|nr:DEAD/DEAH box helicase [Spirochaetales bacterium]
MKFEEFNLGEDLLRGIKETGFTECMQVQEESLKSTLEKKDVYVQSQTGSGKTAAFLVSIFELFTRETFENKRALVIVPTRELAVQIEREAKTIGAFLPYRIGSVYGGVGYAEQEKMLRERYEIIIGTPGRLIDLEQSRKLKFKDTSILVIDEADRLFDMGFLPDLRKMLRKMPDKNHRMTMLFSATLSNRVWQLAWEHMNDPVEIAMNPEKLTVDEITQELYHVSRDEKLGTLLGILEKEKPENTLIFSNTKSGAYDLAHRLSRNGYSCEYIIGDMPQKKRIHVIDLLKAGKLSFLVATDVAARGLHVDDLDLVVNYDIPEDPENYVHRIGRTARAGKSGKAISLACERFVYGLEAIEALIDTKIPVVWADHDMLKEDKSAGMHFNRHRDKPGHGGGNRQRQGRSAGAHHGGPRQGGTRSGGARAGGARASGTRASGTQRGGPRQGASQQGDRRPSSSPSGAPRQESPRPERAAPLRGADNKHTAARSSGESERKNTRRPQPHRKVIEKAPQKLDRDASMDERLKYYRAKYGEDFTFDKNAPSMAEGAKNKGKPGKTDQKSRKKGLFTGIFSKKKGS